MTIDWWTLGLQTVNVVVLMWLLKRFFWQPVSAMIEERQTSARKILADAEAVQAKADASVAEIEHIRAGFAKERESIVAEARDAGEKARQAILADAASETAALQTAARAAIEKEEREAQEAWSERAGKLAIDIAGRLAARFSGPAVRDAFLGWLIEDIRALPETTRQAASAKGARIEAITATALDALDQKRFGEAIAEALGTSSPISFVTDPGLIAGVELRGPNLTIANSWRADLNRILVEIGNDKRA